jgi:hypothetical protein
MAALPKAPTFRRATRTEEAINAAIDADGGNLFRELLKKHLPKIEDAYRKDETTDNFRSHLGASQIGKECERALFYSWRWSYARKFIPRMLRLFNRGHQEEARFLAMLEMIGVQFYQPEDGGQERISDHGGHFGSALDGVLWDIPDCRGEWVLGEFKTHNTKSFCDLVVKGVQVSKPEHYAQMQACMARRGIHRCFYMAVNKNDDDIFCQLVDFDPASATHYLERARTIIEARTPPKRLSEDPSNFKCGICDAHQRCHFPQLGKLQINCRTCRFSVADIPSGTWGCELKNVVLDKADQMQGCGRHEPIPELIAR